MIISAGILTAAKQRGDDTLAHRPASPGDGFTCVDDVVDLLAGSTSPRAQPGARALLYEMAATPWLVVCGAHASADDRTPHVTVEVGGTRYHLRLDARQCVFDITSVAGGQTQRPAGSKPWVAPGA